MTTIPTATFAEAWRGVEGARRAGWHISILSSIDSGWEATATRPEGRRFRESVRARGRDIVAVLEELIAGCERADETPEADDDA